MRIAWGIRSDNCGVAMDQSSLDAIAERIARIGRRDKDTAVAAPIAAPDQMKRVTSLLDQAVGAMSDALDRSEERSEGRSTRALDAVSVWLEKRDSRDAQVDRRIKDRDAVLDRTMMLLVERLEDIDQRLSREPVGDTAPLRETVQDIETRLDRVSRVVPRDTAQADQVARALGDLDRRMQDIASKLDAASASPKRIQCDQTDNLKRLEGQLAQVLAAVRPDTQMSGFAAQSAEDRFPRRPLMDRDLAGAVDEISERQRRLDEESDRRIEPVMREMREQTDTVLRNLKTEIGALASRFSQPRDDDTGRQDVRSELNALSFALNDLAPRQQVSAIETALRELSGKIELSRNEGVREAMLAPIERLLTDIRLSLESYREPAALNDINRDIAALRQRVETFDHSSDATALDDLRQQMIEMRDLVSSENTPDALVAIERQVSGLAARLEQMASRPTTQTTDPAITAAIADIRSLLDRADPSRTIEAIEERLGARMAEQSRHLEAKIDAGRRAATVSPEISIMVDQLAQRLDSIQTTLDQPASHQTDFDRIARHVSILENKIDSLPERSGDTDALADMVRQLAGKLEDVEGRIPDVMALADVVRRLADQVDAGATGRLDQTAIAALEAQIASATARMGNSGDHSATLARMEQAVAELFAQLASLKSGNDTAVASAARDAVHSALQHLGPDTIAAATNDGVVALAQTIQSLKQQQNDADRRNQDTLGSVHDTLEKIVDRLAMLETDLSDARKGQVSDTMRSFALNEPRLDTLSLGSGGQGPFSRGAAAQDTPATVAAQPEWAQPVAPLAATLPGLTPSGETQKSPSFVMSMRQMMTAKDTLDASSGLSTLPVITPAMPGASLGQFAASVPSSEPFLSGLPADRMQANPSDFDASLDTDLPLEPGTGKPRKPISEPRSAIIEPAPELATATEAARSDFLKLARKAMSGGQTADATTSAKNLSKVATKAAKTAPRTDRISVLDLQGSAKASTSRKVVPLLGAAAVVAAAGIGGTFWYQSTIRANPAMSEEMMAQPMPDAPIQSAPAPQAPLAVPAPAPIGPQTSIEPPRKQARVIATSDPATTGATVDIDTTQSAAEPKSVGSVGSAVSAKPIAGSGDFAAWPSQPKLQTTTAIDAMNNLRSQAEKGDAAAQYELGVRLADGRDLDRDTKTAIIWLEKAAKSGLAPAQYRLGALYREGKGVTANNTRAQEWFKKAAQSGNARAMHNLAVVMAEGAGGAPDYAAAGEWFRQAAEYGIKDSQYNVAILYARGLGVPQDLGAAYKWFDAASQQGDTDAAKKRDEIGARMDAQRLALARSEADAFKPKPLDPAANEVVVPSYGATANAAETTAPAAAKAKKI